MVVAVGPRLAGRDVDLFGPVALEVVRVGPGAVGLDLVAGVDLIPGGGAN